MPTCPLDAWYVAAWDHEVARTPVARTVAGKPIVLYRSTSGSPVALADACWHRLAPLSLGVLVGEDQIQCPYHGIRYDGSGRCTFMPAQETINPSAVVAAFPVVERYRYLWVWPGDPSRADPALVPDLHWNSDPGWAGDGATIPLNCDYRLVLDNLMDLTHEEFVHANSIGSDISVAGFDSAHTDRTATITRWMRNIEPPPFWARNLRDVHPDYRGPVDRWQIITFEAPSTISIDVGVAKAGTGAPEGDRSQGVNGYVLNTITPRTETTCDYHWAFARNYLTADQSITTRLRDGVARLFQEDVRMLEAQQRAIAANPGHEFYNLNIDAGSMWVRRILQRLIDAESGTHLSAVPGRVAG
jgi:vanillate O-demethylase monooxygenase subunit